MRVWGISKFKKRLGLLDKIYSGSMAGPRGFYLKTLINGRNYKEVLFNWLNMAWGWPGVLSMAPIVQIYIKQVVLTWALLSVPFTCVSGENQWVRGSFILTNRSVFSIHRGERYWIEGGGGHPRPGLTSKNFRLNTSAEKGIKKSHLRIPLITVYTV
jgi:hypothetical protein